MKIINFFPSYEHIEESQMRFASINIYSDNINICTKMICHGIKIITKFIIHAHLSNIKVSYKPDVLNNNTLNSYHIGKHIKSLHVNTIYVPPKNCEQ